MHHGLKLVKTVGPLAQNVQEQVNFAGRELSEHLSVGMKKAPTCRCWRRLKLQRSVCIKNAETITRNKRNDVTAAETKISIGGIQRVRNQVRPAVVRIN